MKNILLAFTGGTIGSLATDGCIDISAAAPFTLLQQFRQHYPDHGQVSFTTIQPLDLLSENLAPAAWQTLIAAIEAEQPGQYDGIIITHGTDTLSYTAAALGFYFHALDKPVLLVSSDYPLDKPEANGLENFGCAVDFIVQVNRPGVFVPYRNRQQITQIHLGTRLSSCLPLSGDFISVQHKSHMQYENRRFTVLNPIVAPQTANIALAAQFSERILMIKPYPGLDYRTVNLDQTDAVLHDLYHSGTACVSRQWGASHSLLEFINRCRERAVKVYLAPIIKSADAYLSTRLLIDQGAEIIWNMSIEAAYTKLALAYGNFSDGQDIMAFISADMAGEHVSGDGMA
ncbi:MAG: asparaginase domain-containing protein [Methylovulum sp.]|nr:asparaginase domain-containing protein [Methylovulum sp.]